MRATLTILGCGPSGGVPRLGPEWGNCDPKNQKNRRRRCAVLIQRRSSKGETNVLIDTPPDLREQLLETEVRDLDGVLFTHDHADHTHGIDDLRPVCYARGHLVDCYLDAETQDSLMSRFAYCFRKKKGSGYSPIMRAHRIENGQTFRVSGAGGPVRFLPIRQIHGKSTSLGFRIGNLAYSPDVSDLQDESVALLQDLDVWIVDALRWSPHPSHFHVARAIEWIDRLKPKRAILTHMTTDLDYAALLKELPEHVEPAYDGMEVEIDVR